MVRSHLLLCSARDRVPLLPGCVPFWSRRFLHGRFLHPHHATQQRHTPVCPPRRHKPWLLAVGASDDALRVYDRRMSGSTRGSRGSSTRAAACKVCGAVFTTLCSWCGRPAGPAAVPPCRWRGCVALHSAVAPCMHACRMHGPCADRVSAQPLLRLWSVGRGGMCVLQWVSWVSHSPLLMSLAARVSLSNACAMPALPAPVDVLYACCAGCVPPEPCRPRCHVQFRLHQRRRVCRRRQPSPGQLLG